MGLGSADIKILYNFTYRLSGNMEIARSITEKVFLLNNNIYVDKILLAKCAWEHFLQINRQDVFVEEDPRQQVLSSLAPELRCAVILRDIMGYSYEQIGAVLDKPKREIAVYISMGRQEIKGNVS